MGCSTRPQVTVGGQLTEGCDVEVTPEEAVEDLQDQIQIQVVDGVLGSGQANGLTRPLVNVQRSLDKGKIAPACSQLQDFIDGVVDKTPEPLDASTAEALIAAAESIRTDLGCADLG
jgi:hypothetical protein